MNIYEGPSSAYARNEGIYVPGEGVNLTTGVSILYLLLRDLRRGWTYDHKGRVIPMNWQLFKARAKYLYPLCVKHTNTYECEKLKQVIDYVLMYRRLPEWAKRYVKLARVKKVELPVPIPAVTPRTR